MLLLRLVLSAWIANGVISSAWAQPLSHPPPEVDGYATGSSLLAVLLSLAKLPASDYPKHRITLPLSDGTTLEGVLFVDESQGLRPLVIADFGLMSTARAGFSGNFINEIVKKGKLNANFLAVNDMTSADFYAANSNLGIGGYDAGRLLIEVADQVVAMGVPFSSLHLLGESLGGLAALEALIEDQRQGMQRFQSAITFSGVLNEEQATQSLFETFGRPLAGINAPKLPIEGTMFIGASLIGFDQGLDADGLSSQDQTFLGSREFFLRNVRRSFERRCSG
jgi:hypothetical protein